MDPVKNDEQRLFKNSVFVPRNHLFVDSKLLKDV
jgi:hypothetical protein